MKMQRFFLLIFVIAAWSQVQAQNFRDSLPPGLADGLNLTAMVKGKQLNQVVALKQTSSGIQVAEGFKMLGYRDSLLYVVPADFRGKGFSVRALSAKQRAGKVHLAKGNKVMIYSCQCPENNCNCCMKGGSDCKLGPYRKGKARVVVPLYTAVRG